MGRLQYPSKWEPPYHCAFRKPLSDLFWAKALLQTVMGISGRTAAPRRCLVDYVWRTWPLGGVGFVIILNRSAICVESLAHLFLLFIPSLISLLLFFSPPPFTTLISRDFLPNFHPL